MELVVGKAYRTRGGEKVTIDGTLTGPEYVAMGSNYYAYTAYGRVFSDRDHTDDILAEWQDEAPAPQPETPAETDAPDCHSATMAWLDTEQLPDADLPNPKVDDPIADVLRDIDGITYETELRDRVAITALDAIPFGAMATAERIAADCYEIADAFMAARKAGA